jgi:hypothetical protein
MGLRGMWKSADKPRIVQVEVIHERKSVTRTTISPASCEECDGKPSDECWEQYNCLVAFERKFDKPFSGSGK